jgi:hypothetical protein
VLGRERGEEGERERERERREGNVTDDDVFEDVRVVERSGRRHLYSQ